jgi:hypothetical protein
MFHKLSRFLTRKNLILVLAVLIALIAAAVYVFSGQSSLDLNTRELKNSDKNIEQVSVKQEDLGQKTLEVKCQDGSSYEVYLPPGETSYDALSASKCQQ